MIENLYIKNVALIDELEISFEKGLNLLLGETGSGKSVIIDCINFVLGEKFDKDFLRSGETEAVVNAVFSVNNDIMLDVIGEMGIVVDENCQIMISRSMNENGKTTARLNGKVITQGMLSELAGCLIDVHGQHQHQSLLNPKKYLDILDAFCPEAIENRKERLGGLIKEFNKLNNEIEDIIGEDGDKEEKIELYRYQIQEIENANLRIGEEEELLSQRKILQNAERLRFFTNESLNLLYRGDSAARDNLSVALSNMYSIAEFDSSMKELSKELEGAVAVVDEVVSQLRGYEEMVSVDDGALNEIENRLDTIYSLKRKYGQSEKDIIDYYNKTALRLKKLEGDDKQLKELTERRDAVEKVILNICAEMTGIRSNYSKKMQEDVKNNLTVLGMPNADFEVNIDTLDSFSVNGFDHIDFMFSANLGEPKKHLNKIASGGEMSRVMLALKAALADNDNIESFVFDEIDTGVSGETADRVCEILKYISGRHQVICITHLPQIASGGNCTFLVEKNEENGKTLSSVRKLEKNEIIEAIARLMSGAQISENTLKAAEEMLDKKI